MNQTKATMATLTCPDCGETSEREEVSRAADSFCERCDFPLFWAPAAAPLLANAERETDEALRRLPGAGGHRQRVSRACPACGEPNPGGRTDCLRCGALLDPPPPEPVELEPAPVVVVAPPPPPPARNRWFWPALVGGLVLVTIIILVLQFA